MEALYSRPAFGSDFSHDSYQLDISYYHDFGPRKVLATHFTLCSVSGRAPFFSLCLFGSDENLRGYVSGQYRDRHMFILETEYRWQIYKRFGVALFAGLGAVAPDFLDYSSDDLLPSYRIGLRYLASEAFGVNLSIDFARGKNSNAIYFRIGEAF